MPTNKTPPPESNARLIGPDETQRMLEEFRQHPNWKPCQGKGCPWSHVQLPRSFAELETGSDSWICAGVDLESDAPASWRPVGPKRRKS